MTPITENMVAAQRSSFFQSSCRLRSKSNGFAYAHKETRILLTHNTADFPVQYIPGDGHLSKSLSLTSSTSSDSSLISSCSEIDLFHITAEKESEDNYQQFATSPLTHRAISKIKERRAGRNISGAESNQVSLKSEITKSQNENQKRPTSATKLPSTVLKYRIKYGPASKNADVRANLSPRESKLEVIPAGKYDVYKTQKKNTASDEREEKHERLEVM